MRLRIDKTFGIAAALTLGLVGTAAAQTASDRRIPVTRKDAGEVLPPRVDTVRMTVYRTDTLRLFRTDTMRINVPGPTITNTVTRYDTVTMERTPGWMHRGSGLYFGLGG